MILGKKKNGQNLRTLTEKEIQDKLYGSYRSAAAVVQDEPRVEREVVKPVIRTSEASDHETVKPVTPRPTFSRPPVKALPVRAETKKFLKESGVHLGSLVKVILTVPLRFLQKILLGLAGLLISFDFRKPKIRLLTSWLVGLAFLGLLFVSIHHLNMKREGAMKNPPKHAHAKTVQASKAHAAPVSKKEGKETSPQTAVTPPESNEVTEEKSVGVSSDAETEITPEAYGYAIQVATFAAREDADRLVTRLGEAQLDAFVKPLSRVGGRTYYCVFTGRFKTFQKAQKALELFRKKSIGQSFRDAFVRSI